MRKLVLLVPLLLSCSAEQTKTASDAFKELAGSVCVAGESWEACVSKCAASEAGKTVETSPSGGTPATGGAGGGDVFDKQ